MSLPHVAKIIMIGLIFMDLEGFCITMATVLDFSKILFPPDVTGPTLHMHVRFRSDPSRNHDGVRARGHKPYCFYCMISHKDQNDSQFKREFVFFVEYLTQI